MQISGKKINSNLYYYPSKSCFSAKIFDRMNKIDRIILNILLILSKFFLVAAMLLQVNSWFINSVLAFSYDSLIVTRQYVPSIADGFIFLS